MAARKLSHTRWFFSCLSEIGSKRKLSFGRQLLSNSVCVRKTLFVTRCPKFKAKVSISVAINPVSDRHQYNNLKTTVFFTIRTDPKPANNMFIFSCSKLVLQPITNRVVYSTLSLNRVSRCLLTICKKNLPNERVTQILDKERCIRKDVFKNKYFCSPLC